MTPSTYEIKKEHLKPVMVYISFDDRTNPNVRRLCALTAEACLYHAENYKNSIVSVLDKPIHADLCATLAVAADELRESYGYYDANVEIPF